MSKPIKEEIGNILELQRGYDLPVSKMVSGKVPVAGSNGIIGYHNESKIQGPCITVGRSGTVGKVNYYKEAIWPHNTSLYIKDFKNNNPKYIYYLLKSLNLEQVCGSSVVPSLNRNFVYPMKILFHKDYDNQKKIADVLSSIDDKIALNNKTNTELENMAKTIYDYWFTQFDFPDKNGHPYKTSGGQMVYNEILKREIPTGWEVGKLNDLLLVLKDGTHNPPKRVDNGIPLLTGTMFGKTFLDYSQATFISKEDYNQIHSQYQPNAGDIILTKIGTLGNVNYLRNKDIPIAIHCNSALLRFNKPYNNSFALLMCKSDLFYSRLRAVKGQSIQEFVSLDKIANIEIEIPDYKVVEQFNIKMNSYLQEIERLQNENEELTKLRDYLLPLLMNGQIEVK